MDDDRLARMDRLVDDGRLIRLEFDGARGGD